MSQQIQQSPQSQPPAVDEERLYPTRSYQPQAVRVQTIRQLDQLLADTVDLASQARFAHWNVRGMNFFQLHELFEELYEALAEQADEIAERAAALGGQATGTVRAAAAASRLPAIDPAAVTGPECVEQLVERLAIHDANLYSAIENASDRGDLDTADLLNEVSREVGKYRWFLEAHLDTQPVPATQQAQPQGVRQPTHGAPRVDAQQPRAGGPEQVQQSTQGGLEGAQQQLPQPPTGQGAQPVGQRASGYPQATGQSTIGETTGTPPERQSTTPSQAPVGQPPAQ